MKAQVCLTMDIEVLQRLDRLAKANLMTRTKVINEALREFLPKLEIIEDGKENQTNNN